MQIMDIIEHGYPLQRLRLVNIHLKSQVMKINLSMIIAIVHLKFMTVN